MAEFIGKVGLSSDLSSTPIDEGFLLSTDDGALYLDYKGSGENTRYNIVPKKVDSVKKVTLESGAIIKVTTQDGQSEYYSVPTMGAASASTGGTKGLVPASAAGDQAKYLRADGTWGTIDTALSASSENPIQNKVVTASITSVTSEFQTSLDTKIDNNSAGYIKGLSVNGKVITITKGDNSTSTITTQDTTYSAAGTALGLVKSGGDVTISNGTITVNDDSHNHTIANIDNLQTTLDGKLSASSANYVKSLSISGKTITVTKGDGNTSQLTTQDTTYSAFKGATSSAAGSAGLVPAPASGDTSKYLKSDGTWAEVTGVHNFTIDNDTTGAQIVTQLDDYPDSIFSVNIANINGCTLTGMASVSIEDISGDKTVSVACGNYVIAQIASSESIQTVITGGRVYLISNSFSTVLALQNLVSELEGKIDSLAITDVSGLQDALDGKAASSHTHSIANITDLQTTLDGKAASTHTHEIADVTNLQTTLDGKLSTTGTAAAANKLATARTITLGSDCSGSVSFDGSTNVTLNVTVKDDSHNHTIANVDNLQSQLNTISSNASSAKTVTDKYSAMLNIIGNNQ